MDSKPINQMPGFQTISATSKMALTNQRIYTPESINAETYPPPTVIMVLSADINNSLDLSFFCLPSSSSLSLSYFLTHSYLVAVLDPSLNLKRNVSPVPKYLILKPDEIMGH